MASNKRICFFIRDMSSPAGTERVTAVLANQLAKSGYRVDIVTLTTTESYFELDTNVRIYALGATSDKRFLLGYPWYLIKLSRLALNRRYDVLINVAVMMIYASWVLRFVPSCRIISWEHYNIHIKPRPFISAWARSLAHALSRKVVLLTPRDKDMYQEIFKRSNKLVYIPNPVTISSAEKATPELTRIVAVGRYTAQKGFDLLLDAWSLVCQQVHHWELEIVGDGEDRMMLQTKAVLLNITESVQFSMPTNDIVSIYKRASCFVLSSRFEGMPLVLLEAMHMGLPLVAFDCEFGPAELIRSGYNGLLVENGNVNQLAQAMLLLIRDKEKRIRMSSNALESAEKFTVNAIAKEWVCLFSTLT